MACYHAPQEWEEWNEWLAAGLHGRSRWRLSILMMGILFAGGRRVVSAWIRAAGIQTDYRDYYYFLQSLGRRWQGLGDRILMLLLRGVLANQERVVLVIDDSPTKRYGPQVQGAGTHHDPTPGPTRKAFCYGHVWVTLAVVIRHPLWGSIGLPIFSWLYVRERDVPNIPEQYNWEFQTKTVQAANLVCRAAKLLQAQGKKVWVVADGAYTTRSFVKPVMRQGVTLVGRLRKDSKLFDLPTPEKPGASKRRGRTRIYGENRISLIKRAAHKQGWQEVKCWVYGQEVVKQVKTFLATHSTFGGAIRVVIVREDRGPQFLYCTDIDADVRDIIEVFSDRSTIEQVFHDVKEVWGSGQQQVRNLWSNIGVWHLNLWMHTLVELWCWNRKAEELVHREDSPWDVTDRRPSHADRRKALQAECLRGEFSLPLLPDQMQRKIQTLIQRLLRISI